MVLNELCYEYSFVLSGYTYEYFAEKEFDRIVVYRQTDSIARRVKNASIEFSFEEFQEFCQDHAGLLNKRNKLLQERNKLLQEKDQEIPICCVVL